MKPAKKAKSDTHELWVCDVNDDSDCSCLNVPNYPRRLFICDGKPFKVDDDGRIFFATYGNGSEYLKIPGLKQGECVKLTIKVERFEPKVLGHKACFVDGKYPDKPKGMWTITPSHSYRIRHA